ncbi:Polyketide synthase PksM [Salix suchowensis]|nr:Polyketide synthase PksM [Salix suchowensis]
MDTTKTTILDSLLGMGAFRDNTGTLRPPQIEEINLNQSIADLAEFDDSAYNDAHFRFIETGVNMFDIDNDTYDSLIAEFARGGEIEDDVKPEVKNVSGAMIVNKNEKKSGKGSTYQRKDRRTRQQQRAATMAEAATANEDAKLVEKVKRLRDSEQERSKHEIWEKLYQIITELHSSLNQQQAEEIKRLTTTIAVLKFQVKEQRRQQQGIIREILTSFLGKDTHVHFVISDNTLLARLAHLETHRSAPLQKEDPEFPHDTIIWIHEQGTHLIINTDSGHFDIIGIILAGMSKEIREEIKDNLDVLMRWTRVGIAITSNAAHKGSKHVAEDAATLKVHGQAMGKDAEAKSKQRRGEMEAIGWHTPMGAKGKRLLSYAHRPTKHAKAENKIPSFAAETIDGVDSNHPFANALTITHDNFSNFLHTDKDEIEIAYGMWWAGRKEEKGGQLVMIQLKGTFKVGLVEVFWRGKVDSHATMRSRSKAEYTRFGTSIQLTQKGTSAVANFWAARGNPALVVTPLDRIAAIHSPQHKKRV